MTAHYIARVVESLYNKVDIDKMSAGFDKLKKYEDSGRQTDEWVNRQINERSYIRWCQAIGVLESYLRQNYSTFVETELVYKWAKGICDTRNKDLNTFRAFGNPFGTKSFDEWLKNPELKYYNFGVL